MRRSPSVPRLYGIADAEALSPRSLSDGVRELVGAGVTWIQLRAKNLADDQFCREVERSCRAVEGAPDCFLWVNDRCDLAAIFPVQGVHLGQSDLPPAAARRAVGEDLLLGRSTHSLEQAVIAENDVDVDIVAIGPIFATSSKALPDPAIGLGALPEVRARVTKPLVAIGGIDATNADRVLETGVDCVAVIGALLGGSGDIGSNYRRFRDAIGWQRERKE